MRVSKTFADYIDSLEKKTKLPKTTITDQLARIKPLIPKEG